jgi:uncharacterized membrane protein
MRSRRTATGFGIAGLLLALTGLGISVYLTVEHYAKLPLACPNTGIINCTKVTHSSYSTQFGIPLPVFGLAYFVIALAFQNPWSWRSDARLLRAARLLVAAGGAVTVLWLIWVEFARLDAICLWCTGVHTISIILFLLTGVGTVLTSPLPDVDDDDDDEDWEDDQGPTAEDLPDRGTVPAR